MPDGNRTRSIALVDVDVVRLLSWRLAMAADRAAMIGEEVTPGRLLPVAEAMAEAQVLFEILGGVVDGRRVRLVVDPETGP